MDKPTKSVITCDVEGRIETFSPGAEAMFGYSAAEIVDKRRVSLFSPGLVVLEHVGAWLATAVAEGAYEGDTVFVRKDGSRFAAHIRITPTFRGETHIGFCGVTVALPDRSPEEVMPPISTATKILAWVVVTRAPFLTATLVPILLAGALVAFRGEAGAFPWAAFVASMIGGLALHVAANVLNDYYDWSSGTDALNNGYFQPFSGGSRAVELGLTDLPGLMRIALGAIAVASVCGAWLLTQVGPGVLAFGAAGIFAGWAYTAPPLRLVARKGLGELVIGLSFGPLLVAGTSFALRGTFEPVDLLVGLPLGLLTTAILWINEFPDVQGDALAGKNNLVVVLGLERARWGYLALMVGAVLALGAGIGLGALPVTAGLALLAAPVGIYSTRHLFKHYNSRALVSANKATIQLQLVAGLLMCVGLLVA